MSDLLYKPDKTRRDIEELLAEHKNLIYYRLTQMGQLHNQDAESAAWEALWDAIGTYSVYEKTAFSTYACACITNAINGVLRKQLHEFEQFGYCELNENIPAVTKSMDEDSSYEQLKKIVQEVFDEHLAASRGLARDILLFWRSVDFEENKTTIAKACNTSVSYVSRVIQGFKARLSGRLKGH